MRFIVSPELNPRRRALRMKTSIRAASMIPFLVFSVACSKAPEQPSTSDAVAGIDSLNARLVKAYRDRDPQAYGALYTDSAVFEWPAFNTVRGPAALEAMVRGSWPSLNEQALKLIVSSRRVAADHATEFGAFEQSWSDPQGIRHTEFGRYATYLVRHPDNSWRIDRFFGFADSTLPKPPRP